MFAFDAALPHAWARDPSRQLQIAECRCKLFLPILCGVACAVQPVLKQLAHVFVTCLAIFWRPFDEYSSSCWSVEIRPSHVNQYHIFSSTFTRGDLRQHYFQRFQRRRRRVQLWPRVRLLVLRDPPRAHVGLLPLSFVSLRPSCLDGRLPPPYVLLWRTAQVKPPACVVIPMPFPQAEQFLLIVSMSFPNSPCA